MDSTPVPPSAREKIGLPPRVFLYTLDQIAMMLNLEQTSLERGYIYFEGRSIGARPPTKMVARNIAPPDKNAEWRVTEREFIRWMRGRGFRYYTNSGFSS